MYVNTEADLPNLIRSALQTDGEIHKQWYLFQIAKVVMDLDEVAQLRNECDEGIPP